MVSWAILWGLNWGQLEAVLLDNGMEVHRSIGAKNGEGLSTLYNENPACFGQKNPCEELGKFDTFQFAWEQREISAGAISAYSTPTRSALKNL